MRLTSELILSLVDRVTGPARRLTQTIGELPRRLSAAQALNNRRMTQMRGRMLDAAGGAYVLANALKAPISAAMDFESAMADVTKVVDFPTPEGLEAFQQSLIDMSRRIPMAAADLATIVAAAGQAGIAREDLLRFTEQAAKIGVAFDIGADQAGESMAKLMTGLGLTVDEVGLLADAMNHLSNSQAATASDILEVVRRVGAQGKQFGFAATEVSAFASAMVAAGAAPEVAATSFMNLGKALTKGTSATKSQQEAFQTLGLTAEDVAKRMQEDAAGTTQDILERLSAVPGYMRASVASDLFGDEARALGPLITNLDLLKESLGLVGDQSAYAGSAAEEYQRMAGTTAGALKRLKNQMTALGIAVGAVLLPPLNHAIEVISPLIQRVTDLAAAHPEATRAIVLGAAALVGLRVAALGAQFSLGFLKGAALMVARPFVGAMAGMARGVLTLLNPLRLVRTSLQLLKVALVSTGIGAIAVGLGVAAAFIVQNWEGVKAAFGSFKTAFMEALGPVKPVIDPVLGALSDLWAWIGKVTGPLDTSTWVQFGKTLGTAVGGAVKWVVQVFQKFQGWFRKAIDAVVGMIPGWLRDKMGITVTAKPLSPEEMETRARERAETARDDADDAGLFASRDEKEASERRGRDAYDAEYATAMAEMQAGNARLQEAQQAAAEAAVLDLPEAPAPIFPSEPASQSGTGGSSPPDPPAQPEAAPVPTQTGALLPPVSLEMDPTGVAADVQAHLEEASADLQMQGKVTLDLTDMDRLMQRIAEARSALSGLGTATRDAADRAAMSLARSRATNLQDRPTS